MLLLHHNDIIFVTTSSATVVASRTMDFWGSYSSFVLADTENNKGISRMKLVLVPSLFHRVLHINHTSAVFLYLHISILLPITGTSHSPYVF